MNPKRKRRASGVGVGLWMMLAHIFEPKKVAVMEQLDTANRLGRDHEERQAGAAMPPAGD